MNFRLIRSEDIQKVAEIYMESFNRATEEQWTKENAKRFIQYWHKRQPDLFFIAERSGEIAGGAVAAIKPYYNGNNLVEGELFVAPKFQKQGLAKKLLKFLIQSAIDKYRITAVSEITYKNVFPLNWYKRIGFKECDLIYIEGNAKEILKNLS